MAASLPQDIAENDVIHKHNNMSSKPVVNRWVINAEIRGLNLILTIKQKTGFSNMQKLRAIM